MPQLAEDPTTLLDKLPSSTELEEQIEELGRRARVLRSLAKLARAREAELAAKLANAKARKEPSTG